MIGIRHGHYIDREDCRKVCFIHSSCRKIPSAFFPSYFSLKIYSKPLDSFFGKQVCKDVGGYLCSIHSQEEEDIVIALIRKHSARNTWLGATGWDSGSDWQWDDGTNWNYTKWRTGQPDPHGDDATCLYTEANGIPNDHDGGWLDGDCHYITEQWNCMCKIIL